MRSLGVSRFGQKICRWVENFGMKSVNGGNMRAYAYDLISSEHVAIAIILWFIGWCKSRVRGLEDAWQYTGACALLGRLNSAFAIGTPGPTRLSFRR